MTEEELRKQIEMYTDTPRHVDNILRLFNQWLEEQGAVKIFEITQDSFKSVPLRVEIKANK